GFLKELKPDILKECFRFGESNFEVGEFYGDAVLEYRFVFTFWCFHTIIA
ncbi:MAG: hypothetical protein EZS28_046482, partial [Streblomastix strix]